MSGPVPVAGAVPVEVDCWLFGPEVGAGPGPVDAVVVALLLGVDVEGWGAAFWVILGCTNIGG